MDDADSLYDACFFESCLPADGSAFLTHLREDARHSSRNVGSSACLSVSVQTLRRQSCRAVPTCFVLYIKTFKQRPKVTEPEKEKGFVPQHSLCRLNVREVDGWFCCSRVKPQIILNELTLCRDGRAQHAE